MHLRAIFAFVFAASLALTSTTLGLVTSGETKLWATTAGWSIAGLAFGAAALAVAVRVGPGRVRTAWLLWATASAFWVAGAIGRIVLGSASGSLPVATFADALWCLFAVVSVAGIAVRSARGSFSFPLYALDALPVVLLAAALAQLTATRHSDPSHTRDVFALAYPIVFVFLALVSTHFITLQGFRRSWRRGSVAFVGGFYLLAAGAVTWAPQTLDGSRVDTFVPGLLWTLGLLVLAGYAVFRVLQPAGAAPYYAPERDRGARSIPPAAAIGGLVLFDILVPEGAWTGWLLFAAVAAFGARSFLVRQATGRLLDVLAAERDFTSAVIETAGGLVCVIDGEGRFVRFNRACEELSGYARDEVTGRPFYELVIPPEEQEKVAARVAGVRAGEFPNEGENHWVTRSGERRLISWKNTALLGADGLVRYVVGTGIDVTEQRRAEEALARNEERFRTLVANVPGAVFRCALDEHWTMEFLSDGIEEVTGYPASDFVGNRVRTYASVTHPEDGPNVDRLIFGAVAGRRPYALEYRVLHADGSVRWVFERGKAHYGADGSALWLDSVLLDVTERKQVEEALRETTETLASLIEASPIAIMAVDRDAVVTLWNPAAERMFGWAREEAIGSFNPVVAEAAREEFLRLLARVLEGESWRDKEITRLRKDGSPIELSVSSGPMRSASGDIAGMVSLIVDVTERKLAEAERERLVAALSEQNERLRELDRLKDEFVALVSHELRTPLTSIRGYLELIIDGEVGDVTPDQAEFLDIVDRNALRLLRLVGDLLLVAQIGSGAMNLVVGEVDLGALAAESVAAAAPAAEKKEVSLTLEASEVPTLQADRSRLAQALDNFLSNAIKFTPRGGAVTLRVKPLPGAVAIEVADTGMGMAPEETELLFQRFFRTAEATRQAIPGTGLGLTITKGIVEAHGGTISVESEQGVGTTFRVVLPTVAADQVAVDNAVMEEAA